MRVLRNRGDGSFEDVSHALGLDSIAAEMHRAGSIAADVDGDGAPDLIVTQLNAPPVLLRNVGANKNHFVRLDLSGYADNKTALGSKVEIFANGQWQKWELAGASGYQTQAPPQILDRIWATRKASTCCAFCGRRAFCRMRSICPTRG